jgi:hypothetical protein
MRATSTCRLAAGWLAAFWLLAAGQVLAQFPGGAARPPQRELPAPFVTRQTDLEIPFSVKAGGTAETQPAAVRVFVSWDRGANWRLYEEKKPHEGRFRFRPKQDGEFWFATQTVDRGGRTDSPEPRWPQLRLVIDTQQPQLKVEAKLNQSGEVNVTWNATDANLTAESLRIEYQDATGSGGAWQTLTLPAVKDAQAGQSTGSLSFEPQIAGRSINLRAEVADGAGNKSFYSQRMTLLPVPAPRPGGLAAAPPIDPSATPWNDNPAPTSAPAGQDQPLLADGGLPAENPAQPLVIDNQSGEPAGTVANPYARQDRFAAMSQPGDEEPLNGTPAPSSESLSPAAENLPLPGESQPYSSENPQPYSADPPSYSADPPAYSADPPSESYSSEPPPSRPSYDDTLPESPPSYEPVDPAPSPEPIPAEPAPSYTPTDPPSYAPATESVDAPQGNRPRLANSRRFSLEYDVESVGPEGLADVELWGTSDGGRTWTKWGADPDRKSPFDVEVSGEATYGFRVVIVGKNGLAGNAPQNGDAADIWVGIDLTRPAARLTGAAYGQGDASGKLDIRWQAADTNLAQRPITLAIADRPDGPFTPIAAGLPNTGQYLWEFDPRSPRQIYLRLEVRDDAGNTTIDQLTEPIHVEGLQPKGRIRGFAPAPETNRGAFRPPLFR